MPDIELIKILANLGGLVVISALLIFFAYKILKHFGTALVGTLQQMAVAMGNQAQCMAEVKDTVCDFVRKDNSDHREILLSLQVVGEELKSLTREVKRQCDGHDSRKTQSCTPVDITGARTRTSKPG